MSSRRHVRPVWLAAATMLLAAGVCGCGGGETMSGVDAGNRLDASAPLDGGPRDAGRGERDAGPLCIDDTDCDDAVDCTVDRCDPAAGCLHTADDSRCETMFCTTVGATCDVAAGCLGGSPRDCSDGDPCTFDRCSEVDRRCESAIEDADGDGAPDAVPDSLACTMALDCLLGDPLVHPGAEERCNGEDDDCDGRTDEDFECITPRTAICTTSCGTTGSYFCDTTTCSFTPCAPPAEACNATDDDCDELVDETYPCARDATTPCTTTCGSPGYRLCAVGCSWSSCIAPTEVCDGIDNDCRFGADDTFACRLGATRSCRASCGSFGTETCDATCTWGACVPPAETCNGVDDDCDGVIDDGFPCAWYSTRSCTSSCGTTGTELCSGTCAWEGCVPPTETCNGTDDDCDGTVDEATSCGAGAVCSGGACRSIPSSCTGYRYAGHAYAICTSTMTWSSARSTCTSYGGHLVTVTSAGEQSFLASRISGRSWHGLYRGAGCAWEWVTGEPVSFTYWDPGQPSSACREQDCADLWSGPLWRWDDYWCSMTARYVCEWDA